MDAYNLYTCLHFSIKYIVTPVDGQHSTAGRLADPIAGEMACTTFRINWYLVYCVHPPDTRRCQVLQST